MLRSHTARTRTHALLCAGVLLPLIAMTGCSSSAAGSPDDSPNGSSRATATANSTTAPSDATSQSDSPLSIDNCGAAVSFQAAPSRVVTIKSTSTEMLLALGLGDRIVGTSFSDGPVPAEFATGSTPPVLAENIPSQEAILTQTPDLVYAGWESNFSADGAGTRDSYQRLGVNTLVSPSACKESGYRPMPQTFDGLFDEITQVGTIFHVPDVAGTLVAQQRAQLADVKKNTAGLTALWYSSGSDTPYVGAGIGAPQMIMDAAGLANIAADVEDSWSPLSWEVVVEDNPDVIVLIDSSWGSVKKKIGVLESNPATAQLDAVIKHRYLVLPFASSEAGIRSVSAVVSLVHQLDALGIAG